MTTEQLKQKKNKMNFESKPFTANLNKVRLVISSSILTCMSKTKKYLKVVSGLLLFMIMVSFIVKYDPKFEIRGTSSDKKYGYSEQKPIRVGGGTSAGYHFIFLEHLRGPKGETLEVDRIGSCGSYPNPDTTLTKFKEGVLTCFSIKCPSFKKPKVLYFDKYRTGDLYIPKDLTWKE